MSSPVVDRQLEQYRSGLLRGDLSYVFAAVQKRGWTFDPAITEEQRRVTNSLLDQVVRHLGCKPEADPDAAMAALEKARAYWSTEAQPRD